MFITALLITSILVLLHWAYMRRFGHWKRKGFPYLPGTFPYGTDLDFTLAKKYHGTLIQEFYNKLSPKPYGGFFIWNQPFLLIRDPEIIRLIMTKDFSHFRDRGRLESHSKSPLSQHLFSIDGDIWRAMRIKLTPTFTSGRLKNMFSIFEACSKRLDEELLKLVADNKNESVNIKDFTMCFTLDTITSCAFGLETNAAENIEFRKKSQILFRSFVKLHLKIKLAIGFIVPSVFKLFGFNFLEKDFEDFFINLITKTVKYREENNVRRNDFLDLMIQLKNKGTLDNIKEVTPTNGEKTNLEMTYSLLASQCFVFFAAGFETSSSVLSFALYELALNQDIQDRLRKEIDDTMTEHGGATYQALQEMPYMEQIISEAMRKYPTLPILSRQCSKTFTLPDTNVIIEEGTKITIPLYALHHDPKYFPEPEKFDPERFSPENKSSIIPYTYMPFGEGPRHCIGMRFGMLQTKMCLYTILHKYKVLPSAETPMKLTLSPSILVTTVNDPIKLLIKERD